MEQPSGPPPVNDIVIHRAGERSELKVEQESTARTRTVTAGKCASPAVYFLLSPFWKHVQTLPENNLVMRANSVVHTTAADNT